MSEYKRFIDIAFNNVSIMFKLFIKCFTKKYFQFEGRADRKEYIIIELLNDFLLVSIFKSYDSSFLSIILLLFILIVIPSLAVTVRRLHDMNLSGWWVLLGRGIGSLGLGILFILLLIFIKGSRGPNRYGEPPA